jgi:CHAT domain-containing protein
VRPGDESVGMTTALLGGGTSTVVAAVTRIADETALAVMTRLHRALRDGRPAAEALAGAAPADPLSAFVCFGGG